MDIITDFYKVAEESLEFIKDKHDESFLIKDGNNKSVLFSCPHAVKQLRNGNIKCAEPETGVIGIIINKFFQYPLFLKTSFQNDDANYDSSSAYKDELINYVKKNSVRCVIDLHMLSPSRKMDVNIGIANYRNFPNKKVIDSILHIFDKNGFLTVTIDDPFGAFYPYTVSSYVHNKTGIDTIQIEMNSSLLVPDKNDSYGKTKIEQMTKTLVEIAEMLGGYYEAN